MFNTIQLKYIIYIIKKYNISNKNYIQYTIYSKQFDIYN